MTRTKVLPAELRSELDRLLKCAHKASLAGDEVTQDSCLLRWNELYAKARGGRSHPPEVTLTYAQANRHRTAEHVPMWRLRQKLSPVVLIVRVEEVRFRNESGHENNYWIEHLACGHTNNYHETWDYPGRSKRRRCRECGDIAMIAAGYIGDLAQDHKPENQFSTAALPYAMPRGESSQFTFAVKLAPTEAPKPRLLETHKTVAPAPRAPQERPAAPVELTADRRRG